jgi:hypothetical protein
VTIRDGLGGSVQKTELDAKTNKSIMFTAAELQSLDSDIAMQVTLMNNHLEAVGAKQFSIQNQANFAKEITITN